MKHEILPNGNLKISCTPDELPDPEDRISFEEAIESLVANSELMHVSPEVFYDMTDAPMLGIWDAEPVNVEPDMGSGHVLAGRWDDKIWSHRVTHRWAYMDYMVCDPVEELREHGFIILEGGNPWKEPEPSLEHV